MPKISGVNHLDAVRAFQRAGFRIVRQVKHIVMSDGVRFLTIPRHNPVNAFTGLTVDEFKKLLSRLTPHHSPVRLPPMNARSYCWWWSNGM